ncbi:MAG: tRNA (guanosine(46)-N7)-methyltransferase TrmB [Clostridia bacterium]|nr:tRNA (guanosine(46)-N7)-methyltransferase TrmB [Clostridia bacterium]
MRMRRKKHLDERMAACGDYLISLMNDDRRFDKVVEGEALLDLPALFGRTAPVELEIGCGCGQFICELAQQHPDTDFLAVEKVDNIIVVAAEKAKALGLKNVRFLHSGAEYLLRYLPVGGVDRLYLNFSCPYPKASYATHRLTHRRFLGLYERLLKDGGEIWQKTDNRQLFAFSVEEFSACGWQLHNLSLDLHADGMADNIVTEYEQKFVSQGLPIYRLEAQKPPRT